jgi:hypothetical protein
MLLIIFRFITVISIIAEREADVVSEVVGVRMKVTVDVDNTRVSSEKGKK